MKPMRAHANKVYRIMLSKAYSKSGGSSYTTADLLKEIDHNLTTNEMRRLGRKFSSHAQKRPDKFEIVGKIGSNYIYKTL